MVNSETFNFLVLPVYANFFNSTRVGKTTVFPYKLLFCLSPVLYKNSYSWDKSKAVLSTGLYHSCISFGRHVSKVSSK